MSANGPQRIVPPLAPPIVNNNSGASTKVKAILRVRPFLPSERIINGMGRQLIPEAAITVNSDKSQVRIRNPRNPSETLSYTFDACYGSDSTQMRIFAQDVAPVIERVLSGYNATIFAYGNTGAGKTFTMEGTETCPGMIPLTIRYIIETLGKKKSAASFSLLPDLRISYLEIYKEKVYDLLSANPTINDLPIREDANHNILIPDLTAQKVTSLGEFEKLWLKGVGNRRTAATKLNAHSSRSHSSLTIQIPTGVGATMAKLHLIDLAGSEDNRRTANAGERLLESGAINKSLFTLGQVVDALNNNSSRIPYRDSKLTRLLQDSLGGRAYALIIANVAPNDSFSMETYNTLKFASKTRQIENNVTMAQDLVEVKKKEQSSYGEGREKRLKTSSPNTISPVEVKGFGKKKRALSMEEKENNPFESSKTNSIQAMIWEKQIEEKVAEKIRQISKGTILSPLLRGDSSHITASAGGKSPLSKMVKVLKDAKFPKPRKPTVKKEESLDANAQKFLPDVEPELLQIFNFGTLKEIKCVEEIGPKRAQTIIDYRNEKGALMNLADLVEGGLITMKVLSKLIIANAMARTTVEEKEIDIIPQYNDNIFNAFDLPIPTGVTTRPRPIVLSDDHSDNF